MVMAGQGVISPVLPIYADSFGVSTAMIGATVTAFGLARLVTNVPAGIYADRRGRRALLIGGPLITAVGMLGSGLSADIWTLLAFRFVAGLGSGLYMTGAQIYLLDIAAPEHEIAPGLIAGMAFNGRGIGMGTMMGRELASYALSGDRDTSGFPVTTPDKFVMHAFHGIGVSMSIKWFALMDYLDTVR